MPTPNIPPSTRFRCEPTPGDSQEIRDLAARLGITETTAGVLHQRGVRDPEAMARFLDPGLRYLSPLENWPGLLQGASILADSIAKKDKIAVWGDYDVDGVTATAVIVDFFNQKKIPILPVIPSRFKQGYGLDNTTITELAGQGIRLLVTVDCGINDHGAVDHARALGMGVVITDHHLPGDTLPAARAIINPKTAPCPCADLAGVGVAFLLMAALNQYLPPPKVDVRPLLDLVALGTIADVVPLTEENRILVKNGLLVLKSSQRSGIQALKKVCAIAPETSIGSGDVGFGLGPRINAAGRLASADLALDLLMAATPEQATPLANKLNRLNAERKKIEHGIVDQAMAQCGENGKAMGHVVFGPEWHQGVLGIAASRVTERTYRPTVLLARDGDLLKGSGRSVPGVHLYECLYECRDVLEKFGGHPMAAGLSLHPDNLGTFTERFNRAVAARCGSSNPERPPLAIDGVLPFDRITPVLLSELESLQPFGVQCPRPVFISPPVTITGHKIFGRGAHLSVNLRDENAGITLRGVAWRQAATFGDAIHQGDKVRAAFTPKTTSYRGLLGIELTITALFPYVQER
ncbi:single-stranded-DNA-specific exonuclease RecJ [Desulfoplanes sp.]